MRWVGGFEGADHVNGRGLPLSMARDTGHLARLDVDYRRLRRMGFDEVRESAGWRICDLPGGLDLDSVHARMQAAERHGLAIRWTLMHYGVPEGVHLFDDDEAGFTARFASFCAAVARAALQYASPAPRIYNPVNEISFLCWAATCTGLLHPYIGDRAADAAALKARLVRAALAGCAAIRAVDPQARMMWAEPLVHVTAPADRGDLREEAAREHAAQYEVLDMLSGRAHPQLGGSPACVDLIGINYYHANQWEVGSRRALPWHERHPRRVPFCRLLREVHERYGLPLTVSETSHVGQGRGDWLIEVAQQIRLAREIGIDIEGICLYPVVDRPDWEEPTHWHRSGLWDVDPDHPLRPPILARDYARAYADARRLLDTPAPLSNGIAHMRQLLVFSHLRWDFVYQRPQHLLSRFGQRWNVVFFEEPVHDAERAPWLEAFHPCMGVTVLRPHTPVSEPGFADAQFPVLSELLQAWLAEHGERELAVWLYTPMALPLIQGLTPLSIFYDCMDELSAFKNAPERLMDREKTLLDVADLVFTGGPSLQDAKSAGNTRVHCFPSSVDVAHFAQGRREADFTAPVARGEPVRLGFFGVIDERLDLGLLGALSQAHPDWQIELVGPVVKIDPSSLPRAPNLHYLGQRSYADLPRHIASWDVCLLPFALNASTAFISPTKTLEYMAARKPVVSTAVRDVQRLYSAGVRIADDATGFIAACEAALAEPGHERQSRIQAQDALTSATSWDHTAEAMAAMMRDVMAAGLNPRARAYLDGNRVVALPEAPVECLILGAGPTGLSAAYHYGKGSVLVEREHTVGGWCRSIEDQGFRFDHAGHIMFSNDKDVLDLYKVLLGDNVHWQNREAWVYSKGVHTRYPFQGALYGLPPAVLKECLVGAIEARFGPIDAPPPGTPAAACPAPAPKAAAAPQDCCADGVVPDAGAAANDGDPKDHAATGKVTAMTRRASPANFEEFIYQVWGAGVARHFAMPYNTKLWTVPPREMETSWLGGRVPLPNLDEMIEGALQPVAKPVGPNARFGYPLHGGFQALMDGFLPHLQGTLMLGKTVTGVSVLRRHVTLSDGRRLRWQQLVSTLPLPDLVRLLGDEAPERIRKAAAGLRHVSVRCVNLGVGRANLTDKHWIYYPEETIFHRIFVQGNASPHNNPPGGFGLTCEITYSPTKPLPVDGDALIERCIADCIQVGMITPEDPILTASIVDMPYAYVLYDHARAANVEAIRTWLLGHDVILAGRYSEWEYYNSDHAFLAGRRAAEAVRSSGLKTEERAT